MRKKVDPNELLDWWLDKYHNTSIERVLEDHPLWKAHPEEHTRDFYEEYAVTQEQHDEWEKWAKAYTKKVTGIKGKLFDRSWPLTYLNVAPNIKNEKI